MSNPVEIPREKPASIIWLETHVRNFFDDERKLKPHAARNNIATEARKSLTTASSDEVLDITKSILTTLRQHRNSDVRVSVLNLLDIAIPFDRIDDPSKLTTIYTEALLNLPVSLDGENVVPTIYAGKILSRGLPKNEKTYRQISEAFDKVNKTPRSEEAKQQVNEAIVNTKLSLKRDIILAYRKKYNSLSVDRLAATVLQLILETSDLKPHELEGFGYVPAGQAQPIMETLIKQGYLEPRKFRNNNK